MLVRNRYRVLDRLGAGGMGTVFEVEDSLEEKARVALKALWPASGEETLVASLRAEFRVLATLRHPAICQVYDFGRLPPGAIEGAPAGQGGFFLTRELVPGVDLAQAAEEAGRDLGAVAALLSAAATGLEVLHRAGMLHGDFKPKNAIVDRERRVRLIDFGLSGDEGSARRGGTLPYLAPEILARRRVDRRADLYALGVSLFELVSGRLPSGARRGRELVEWHLRGTRPSLADARDGVPDRLVDLTARLLSRDPEERLPTAGEAAAALTACAEELGAASAIEREASGRIILSPVATGWVAELERAFERRVRGEGAALVELVGDPGSGKSTVLTEFGWRAELRGAEVVRARSLSGGAPLGAVGVVLDQIAALTGRAAPAPAGEGETAVMRFAAIARWLREAAARFPLVILVDDLDYADEGSRALLRYLAYGLGDAPVLAVASRERRPDDDQGRVSRAGEVPEVVIRPLARDDVAGMVEQVAGRRDLRLATRVHEHTGGNLLHVVHALSALAERGFPPADSLEALALPPRLEASSAARLEGVAEKERAVLEALAVLGAPASSARIAAVLAAGEGLATSDAAAAAASAAGRGLITADVAGRWRFARPATRQAVYRAASTARRRSLHAATAAALEADGVDAEAPELVLHFARAGEGHEVRARILAALARLRRAGDLAAALALGDEALSALSSVEGAPTRALALELGELARLGGDAERAEAYLAPLIDDPELGDRARLALGGALDDAGEFARAEALFSRVARGGGAPDLVASAARELSRLYLRKGRAEEALALVDEALERGPPERARAHLVAARAYARGSLGRDTEAEAELSRVAERAAADGDHALEATALHYGGFLAFRRGEWQLTRAKYEGALAAAERIGDVIRAGALRLNLASMDFSSGEYARSLSHYGEAVSLFRAAGAGTYTVLARRNLGHLLLELGGYEQARAELRSAGRSAAALGLAVHEIGIEALLGIAAWRAGEVAEGRRRIEVARRRFEELGDDRRASENLLDLAELELYAPAADEGDLDAAESILAAADRITATREDTARRGRFWAMRADLSARRGEVERARTELRELDAVLAEVREQGGRHLEWDLHRVAAAARERLGDLPGAAGHRREAMSLLEAMAAPLPPAHRIAFWQDPRRRRLRHAARPRQNSVELAPTLQSDRLLDRLFRLLDIYRRLSSERDVSRLLELVMDTAVELSNAERGFLLLADDSGRLATAIARNLPPATLETMERVDSEPGSVSGEELPYSRSIAEEVFRTGEPVVSADAGDDPRFDRARSVHALRIESVICMPVHARGRIAGVLYLESRGRRFPLDEDELRLLSAFGDQVAVVLQNARLLAENQRRAKELEEAQREIEGLLAERTELLEQRTEQLAVARRDLAEVHRRFLGGRGAFGMIGRSPAMERVFSIIERVAATDVPVLILGESGTGKELVARALHEHGRRKGRPLVSINCGGLPETILESELFGHARGAFTGADRQKRGLFESAHGGTLFLDEVGETPLRMQAALLRALQEGVIRRVGETRDVEVDVRLVTATNRSLDDLVARGAFREDLYYRLHVVAIEMPPLRERREDIPLLCEHFLEEAATRTGIEKRGIGRSALKRLVNHPWPGNVRQLEHAMTNACVLGEGEVLEVADFLPLLGDTREPERRADKARDRKRAERREILRALEACGGNRSKAARMLGMPRRTFYRRLAEHDIE